MLATAHRIMSLVSTYYKNLIIGIQRGNHKGVFFNAKPIFLLAIISCVDKKLLTVNQISLSEPLIKEYCSISKQFEPEIDITPVEKPYFHLSAEPFYTIVYKNGVTAPSSHARTPSLRFLKDSVEYAQFDDDLWQLLQKTEIRKEFSDAIVTHFLNK